MQTSLVPFARVVDTTSGQLLPQQPKRVGLIFSAPPTNRYTLQFRQAAVLDSGVNVYPVTLPLVLHFSEIHEWMTAELFAISATAPQTISGWEIIAN